MFAAQPELKGRPVVLYSDARWNARSPGLHVFACSRLAVQQGVEAGITLAEARGLFEVPGSSEDDRATNGRPRSNKTPCFLEHEPQADGNFLERLAVDCQRFSPHVGLGESHWVTTRLVKLSQSRSSSSQKSSSHLTPPQYSDTLLLDITGCAHLFRGEKELAHEVIGRLDQQGFRVETAIADTIGAAWAMAHFPPEAPSHRRAHSKNTGSAEEADQRTRIVPPNAQREFLDRLPITALRLELNLLQTLGELDLSTIGQLYDLPRSSLPSRFGKQMTLRLDQALGAVLEPIVPVRPKPRFETSCTWMHPLRNRDALSVVLRQQMTLLVDQLRHHRDGIQRLEVQLDGGEFGNVQFSVGFVRPTDSPDYLSEMTEARLELQNIPREVIGLRLHATATSPLAVRQTGLFNDSDVVDEKQFWQLIDRFSARLGEQAVLVADLNPDAQPEYAFRWRPVTQQASSSSPNRESSQVFAPFFAARPLWLKRRPQPIVVTATVSGGPPIRFRWEGRDYVVLRSWGPERIDTGWWRARPVQREYFRVETDGGQQLWLFRQIATGKWFLQGVF